MRKRLLNTKSFPPACAYCVHGRLAPEETNVLCKHKGVMAASSSCRKYAYDPLKRKPPKPQELPRFHETEFQL